MPSVEQGVNGRVKSAAYLAIKPLLPLWFRLLASRQRGIDKQLDVVLGSGVLARHFEAMQVPSEISSLLSLLAERPPRTILEIGTAKGGTLWLLARTAAPDALIVSVDLPFRPGIGGYPNWRERVYRSFRGHRQKLKL